MRHLLVPAALLLITAANAQVTKSGNGYLFRAKYTKGQQLKYLMTTTTSMSGAQNFKVTSPIALKVQGVAKKIATIEVAAGPVMMNGKQQAAKETRTVKVDERNRPAGGESGIEGFASFTFPEKAVRPGASWDGETKVDSPAGGIAMKARYKFVGIKTVNGKQVAEIKTTFSGNAPIPMTGESTSFIMLSDGSLLKANAKLGTTFSLGGQGAKPMTATSTISVIRQ